MRRCTICGQEKPSSAFRSNRPYDRRHNILTKNCNRCRAQKNKAARHWYATAEMKRRGTHVPHS